MKLLLRVAGVAAILPIWAAHAEEAKNYVWHVYHGADPAASLAVVDKAEVDADEAYWPFFIQCSIDEPWTMTVAGVDAKTLGAAIAAGTPVDFAFIIDGKSGEGDAGGYFPELSFSQMDSEWDYSVEWDLSMLNRLLTAKTLAVKGTGVDKPLPSEGMAAALTEFKGLCESFENEGETAPDALPDDSGGDDGGGDDSGASGGGNGAP
jgi:hypothetical protein